MIKRKSLNSRSWPPMVCAVTGKLATEALHWKAELIKLDDCHTTHKLDVKPVKFFDYSRQCAKIIFQDREGFDYAMTGENGFEVIKKILEGVIPTDSFGFATIEFAQIKRGNTLLLEEVE